MPSKPHDTLRRAALLGKKAYYQNIMATQAANLIFYQPLNELTGTTAKDLSTTKADGVYTAGFTLGQPGIGDGNTSVLFNGTTGVVSLATNLALLNTAMSKTEGTLMIWCRVLNAGVWTDATSDMAIEIGSDANNRVFLQKNAASNTLIVNHFGGGTSKQISASLSVTTQFLYGVTWSNSADQFKMFVNGVQQAATLTGLGTWVGALASGFSAIGDFLSTGSGQPWNGYLAHAAMWKVALSAAEMASLAMVA
jgi:hypothetical protein